MFDKTTINQIQKINTKQNRINPDRLFNTILDFLYGPPKRKTGSFGGSRYDQLREIYFIKPFVDYLTSLGVKRNKRK